MSKRKRDRKKQKELRHQASSKKAAPGAGVPVTLSARGAAGTPAGAQAGASKTSRRGTASAMGRQATAGKATAGKTTASKGVQSAVSQQAVSGASGQRAKASKVSQSTATSAASQKAVGSSTNRKATASKVSQSSATSATSQQAAGGASGQRAADGASQERAPSRRGRKPKAASAAVSNIGTASNANGQSVEWQAFYQLIHDAAAPLGSGTEKPSRK